MLLFTTFVVNEILSVTEKEETWELCLSQSYKQTFIQSYLAFNNVLKILAQKHY